jgi:hypothetical protein
MKLAVKINADKTCEVIDISGNELKALQGAVDGHVGCLTLANNLLLWVNEEGQYSHLDFNPLATIISEQALGEIVPIMGDVVVTGGTDYKGDIVGLTDRIVTRIQEWVLKDSDKLASL